VLQQSAKALLVPAEFGGSRSLSAKAASWRTTTSIVMSTAAITAPQARASNPLGSSASSRPNVSTIVT
jgi:hypothetical protein